MEQIPDDHPGRYELTGDGRPGCSGDPHAESEDKQRVQPDIQDRARYRDNHCECRTSVGTDDMSSAEGDDKRREADRCDRRIRLRVGQHVLGRAEGAQHRIQEAQHDQCQQQPSRDQVKGAVGDDLARLLLLPRSELERKIRRAAYPDQETVGQTDRRQRIRDVRRGVSEVAHGISDKDLIRDVVSRGDEHRDNRGDCEACDQLRQTLAGEPPGPFILRHVLLLPL